MLKLEFDIPVYVDNEANMAALGEAYFGAGRGSDFVLYVSSGVGVGGGIVLNGLLMSGSSGFAGEVGHMRIDPNGIPCGCGGKGCWETLASQEAVFRHIRHAIEAGARSSMEEATGNDLGPLTVGQVLEAARSGDAVALEALRETGKWLGVGIGNLINALNPHRVVLGGVVSLAAEFILPEITRAMAEVALPCLCEACDISVATNGADACVVGGIATVYHKILTTPLDLL
jgi:glucokinase-like ROK family protein